MGEAEAAPTSTERIGRYEIVMQIAKGGMATVYLARAEGLGGFDRYVAVKLTAEALRNDPEFSAHLIEEAKLVAHLRHLNVVPVLDVGECERGVFLVMEYVPGDSLAGLLRRARESGTPLPARVGLRILVDALAGLHAAHEHADEEGHPLHLVHRDFSPQNILVGTDGIARLTDFGIAKAASRASNTVAGNIKGKISYVAPEQATGGEVDRRCDLWAAGVIGWELLARKKLHGTSTQALLEIAHTEPPHVSTANPDVSEALDLAIAGVLKLDRNARTPTAAELARELGAAAKAAGLLAETEEVAEVVTRLTASTLAERKATIAQARRQRIASSPDLSVKIGHTPTPTSVRRSLPSLPEVPISSIAALQGERASEPIAILNMPSPEEIAAKPTLAPPPGLGHDVQPFSEEVAFPLGPPQASRFAFLANPRARIALYAGAGLLSVIVLIVTVIAAVGDGNGQTKPSASASASAMVTAPSGGDVTAAPTDTDAPVKAPRPQRHAAVDEGVWPSMLEITADAPIASVRVDGRANDISAPTSKVSIELDPGDEGKDVPVVATASDGRVATGVAKDGAVTLSFANAKVPAPAPPPPVNHWKKRR
jgi:serine/threonine protein kinase